MYPRQFFVSVLSFVIIVSTFTFLFTFPLPQPKVEIINLYSVTPKIDSPITPLYRQSLKFTDTKGAHRIVHTISELEASWLKTYIQPSLSPQANYLATNYTTHIGKAKASIFRISDSTDLLANADLIFDVHTGLFWSPDERFFVIVSEYDSITNFGRAGLFISYSPFTHIEPIMEFSIAQHQAGTRISNVELIDHKVFFTLTLVESGKASVPQLYSYPLK